jgi:hypothetical protein
MIRVVALDAQDQQVWESLLELRARYPDGWTLIGARMVTLYALEHGRTPPRFSLDADALVNVRLIPHGTQRFSKLLLELGYELIDVSGFGHGHRFRRGGVDIDVLAPDGLHSVDRRVTVPPLHTVEVPGGSQALQRTEVVEVDLGGRRGALPRPNLLGAILVKTRAIAVDDAKDSQRIDVAFLLTLVEDLQGTASTITSPEKRWLRAHPEMNDPDRAWWRAQESQREWGLFVLRTLMT